jgi:hypothetical protein
MAPLPVSNTHTQQTVDPALTSNKCLKYVLLVGGAQGGAFPCVR